MTLKALPAVLIALFAMSASMVDAAPQRNGRGRAGGRVPRFQPCGASALPGGPTQCDAGLVCEFIGGEAGFSCQEPRNDPPPQIQDDVDEANSGGGTVPFQRPCGGTALAGDDTRCQDGLVCLFLGGEAGFSCQRPPRREPPRLQDDIDEENSGGGTVPFQRPCGGTALAGDDTRCQDGLVCLFLAVKPGFRASALLGGNHLASRTTVS
ncbi:hypothetical protein HK102_001252 [Quaeritorhiza haematococci]|nr:hypothetical protein HK102_001252 [Quaeritorhiza haematococci]